MNENVHKVDRHIFKWAWAPGGKAFRGRKFWKPF